MLLPRWESGLRVDGLVDDWYLTCDGMELEPNGYV